MSFGSNDNWNAFYGTYFVEGLGIQGNVNIEPTYKLVVDTLEGNSSTITTSSAITVNNTLNAKNFSCPGVMELGGTNSYTYLDIKRLDGNSDYDVRLACETNTSTDPLLTSTISIVSPGQGKFSIFSAVNNFYGSTIFSNTVTFLGDLIVNSTSISPTILSYLSGTTSNIQTQINNITSSLATLQISYLSGTTSNIQTQLNNITSSVATLQTISLTTTLLTYLSTITSNVQTQINNINTAVTSLQTGSSVLTNIISNGIMELGGRETFTYVDMKHLGGNTDFDVRLGCNLGSSTTSGQGTFSITASKTTFTGDVYVGVNALTSTLLGYLTTVSSNVQTQLNTITTAITSLQSGSTSLTNVMSNGIMELGGRETFTYIDMKHLGGNADYDVRLGCNLGSSTTPGKGTFSIEAPKVAFSGDIYLGNYVLTSTILSYLSSLTANVQDQINFLTTTISSLQSGSFNLLSTLITSGITNSNTELKNNAALNQIGSSTFTNTATFKSRITCAESIYVQLGNSIYISDSTGNNNYIRLYHNTSEAFIDYLGNSFYIRNGTTDMFKIDTYNNAIFYTNKITTPSITSGSVECTGNLTVGNQLTVSNGLTINGLNNQSKYFTLKGSTTYANNYKDYVYKKFDGSSATNSSEVMQIQDTCHSVKINYCYDTYNSSNAVIKGAREIIYVRYSVDNGIKIVNSWQNYTLWQVGDNYFEPSITINANSQLTINFSYNTVVDIPLNWSFAINMI